MRPNYWDNHQALGAAHYRAGHYPQAEAAFKRVVELQPDNAWGYEMLGTVYHATGAVEQALVSYRRAVELRPGLGEAWNNMGNAHVGLAAWDEAIDSMLLLMAPLVPHIAEELWVRRGRPSEG